MADSSDQTVESTGDDDAGTVHVGGRIGPFHIDGMIGAGGMGIVLAGRDPDLDRPVAIKVLQAGRARERLIREAQAMARVSHPNTITIYEVGRTGDEIFIAMELVEGRSLRAWLGAEQRAWREVVTMFIAAGRGLAAVHAAGLVHRDFKPENVMVRADGRPQVGDFGIAADGILPAIDEAPASLTESMSIHGDIVGTPSVMAPEQWRGEAVDARADQFAFSVSLWSAIFGEHPFPFDDMGSLRTAVLAGKRRPRRPSTAPKGIVAALERGLALDPDARWPRLDDLLARLESGLGARRRLAIAAGVIAATTGTATAAAFALAPAAPTDPCPVPAAQIAAVWDAAHASALRAHILEVDPTGGAARIDAAERVVTPFIAKWRQVRIETCRATRVRGEQSDTVLDLRVRCLDARLAEVGASLHYLQRAATPVELDAAENGLLGTAPVTACGNDESLAKLVALPADPAARATALDVAERMTDIEAAIRASQLNGLETRVQDALADARAIAHPPTLARVLVSAATLAGGESKFDEQIAHLREATQVAAAAGDADTEARAWLSLISRLSTNRPDEASALTAAASSAIVRAGNPVDRRVRLLRLQASLHSRRSDVRLADEELAEARKLIESAPERTPSLDEELGGVLFEMGNNASEQGDYDRAAKHYHEVIDLNRRVLGPDSTLEAIGWQNLSDAMWRARRFDEALKANDETTRIVKARLGESARLAECIAMRANIFDSMGRYDDAAGAYRDAVTMFRAYIGADDLTRAPALVGYAAVLGHLERFTEAEAVYDEVIGLYERAHAKTVNVPIAIFNRAELGRIHDRCSDAIPLYQRALSLFVDLKGENNAYVVYPLVGEASCRVTIGQAVAAIPLLERVLALPDNDPLRTAMARAWLGRALVESRRDPKQGLAMAKAARGAMAKITNDPEAPRELRELDRWLATR